MTVDERLRDILGRLLIENIVLATKLEQVEAKANGKQSDRPSAESISDVRQ